MCLFGRRNEAIESRRGGLKQDMYLSPVVGNGNFYCCSVMSPPSKKGQKNEKNNRHDSFIYGNNILEIVEV